MPFRHADATVSLKHVKTNVEKIRERLAIVILFDKIWALVSIYYHTWSTLQNNTWAISSDVLVSNSLMRVRSFSQGCSCSIDKIKERCFPLSFSQSFFFLLVFSFLDIILYYFHGLPDGDIHAFHKRLLFESSCGCCLLSIYGGLFLS